MRKTVFFLTMAIGFALTGCVQKPPVSTDSSKLTIDQPTVEKVIKRLTDSLGEASKFRIERGVQQVASLWRQSDGDASGFEKFCVSNFIDDAQALRTLFTKLERNFEIFGGYFHKMDVALKEPLQLEGPDVEPVDMLFGSYDAAAHLNDDFYDNKIAFLTALNFPFYSLKEKTELGPRWSRLEWAYARMGDRFTARVPADITLRVSQTLTKADAYISDYNIYMGKLQDDSGKSLFPEDMKLISHWGLRDELKSDYADKNGLEKQRMIYSVMKHIVAQSIPQQVINRDEFSWNPFTNKIYKDGKEAASTPEPDKRYEVLLADFHALKAVDPYSPHYPDYISRAFEEGMEIPQEDVEKLFVSFVSNPEVKDVAAFIRERLGRPLEPFDIWYNGFKSRGGLPEDQLTAITREKYPTTEAFRQNLPVILMKLGWDKQTAAHITSLITVDASRGAGHAWGAEMKNDLAHLRTRVGPDGMDYKGYNIAVHEFGHTVEQTITLNDMDYYTLHGVPNTAFTEAIAFLFQKRDLELLGIPNNDPDKLHMMALANFWDCYEIMGVSLVDMRVWKWMYANPDATPAQLKAAVIEAAKEVWNLYYADVLGGKDEPLLAIYSHMIDNPLYLSNYPVGHLIEFQIDQAVEGKNIATEITRMLLQGRIIPQLWMKGAVGREISIEPTLNAAKTALEAMHRNQIQP